MEEKGKKGRMDYTLLLIVVLLVVIGLVILYSTSAYNGQVKFHDSFYYLKKQAFATVLGIVLMLFVAGVDYHIWHKLAWPIMGVSLALLAIVLFMPEYRDWQYLVIWQQLHFRLRSCCLAEKLTGPKDG